jgi:hypothetical protein
MNHVSTEALTTGWMIPRGLIVQLQRYGPSDSNKNVDIKFSFWNNLHQVRSKSKDWKTK